MWKSQVRVKSPGNELVSNNLDCWSQTFFTYLFFLNSHSITSNLSSSFLKTFLKEKVKIPEFKAPMAGPQQGKEKECFDLVAFSPSPSISSRLHCSSHSPLLSLSGMSQTLVFWPAPSQKQVSHFALPRAQPWHSIEHTEVQKKYLLCKLHTG